MPGTFIFRPIEAKLTRDTELLGKMDPYCMFMMAGQKFKTTTSSQGGTHPHWQDSITMPMPLSSTDTKCIIEIRDENVLKDDSVGSFEMDMTEVQMQGKVRKWFSLYHKNKPAGDLLLEATYMSDMPGMSQQMGMGSMEMGGMPMGTMGTMGSMQGKPGMMPSSQMGTTGMSQDPMMMHGGTSTEKMGTMGSMQGRPGMMPSSQMGTAGMSQDPMMMHGGMSTEKMGTMGSMQGKPGMMPSSQMGTTGMSQDPMMMHGGMSTGQMGSMSGMGSQQMHSGMPIGMGTMGTMGTMQGKSGMMPSSQMGTMSMNQEPMTMQGGMPTGQMGMGTMGMMEGQTGTMSCGESGMTCTNPMHQHDKYKKD